MQTKSHAGFKEGASLPGDVSAIDQAADKQEQSESYGAEADQIIEQPHL